MAFTIVENLRGFFNSRPPLVVFMLCLASFAIALITFAYIVKAKDIPDPDVSVDWNTFLEKFSHLQFCLPQNSSFSQNSSAVPKLGLGEKNTAEVFQSIHEKLGQSLIGGSNSESDDSGNEDPEVTPSSETFNGISKRAASTGLSLSADNRVEAHAPSASASSSRKHLENATVSLDFVFIPTKDAKAAPHLGFGQFMAMVTAHMLKLDASFKVKGDEQMSVFLSFPHNLTRSMCEEEEGGRCRQYRVPACITFQSPARLLPRTQKPSREACPSHSDRIFDRAVRNARAGTLTETTSRDWCIHGSRLVPQFSLDDSLTVLLSMHDKSVINLHLMRTSYFLFVMVVTMFCYALIKGRPSKVKAVHIAYDKISSQA
ncbi:transmembrane protein 248 [Aplysia californica]|uniref:Transmembrane protein 248 n=1 Tax=Aplysia californica TaxID=6500 RepID=A0ABM0JE21_APLCA|nr:transmembrane protein 248 [Aplysia californica]XP_005091559.1 transmembrane protein 248 [Aplysia californica]